MQSKYIIGIDPDSKKHGVAYYEDGKLDALYNFDLMELQDFILNGFECEFEGLTVHIENVCANNAVFMKPGKQTKKRDGELKARGRTLGKCQQAQIELERMLEFYEIKVVKHKISKQWKDAKCKQFKLLTGWKGRSNEDTRSAAYFGYIGSR